MKSWYLEADQNSQILSFTINNIESGNGFMKYKLIILFFSCLIFTGGILNSQNTFINNDPFLNFLEHDNAQENIKANKNSIGLSCFCGLGKSFTRTINNQDPVNPFLVSIDNGLLDFSGLRSIALIFGLFIDFTLFSHFGFSTGITSYNYGTEYSFSEVFEGYNDFSLSMIYVQIPLLISLFNNYEDLPGVQYMLSTGIGICFPFSVSGTGSTLEDNYVDLNDSIKENISPFTASFILRGQYNMAHASLPLQLGIGFYFDYQLTGVWQYNFFPNHENTKFSLFTVYISLSYWV